MQLTAASFSRHKFLRCFLAIAALALTAAPVFARGRRAPVGRSRQRTTMQMTATETATTKRPASGGPAVGLPFAHRRKFRVHRHRFGSCSVTDGRRFRGDQVAGWSIGSIPVDAVSSRVCRHRVDGFESLGGTPPRRRRIGRIQGRVRPGDVGRRLLPRARLPVGRRWRRGFSRAQRQELHALSGRFLRSRSRGPNRRSHEHVAADEQGQREDGRDLCRESFDHCRAVVGWGYSNAAIWRNPTATFRWSSQAWRERSPPGPLSRWSNQSTNTASPRTFRPRAIDSRSPADWPTDRAD